MANSIYTQAKTLFGEGQLDWETDDFTVLALDPGYELVHSVDDLYWSDLSEFVIDSAALANKTVVDGVFDADDVNTIVIPFGSTLGSLVIVHDSMNPDQPTRESTSELVVYMETNDNYTDISWTGDDSVVPIRWSNSAGKIFRMV